MAAPPLCNSPACALSFAQCGSSMIFGASQRFRSDCHRFRQPTLTAAYCLSTTTSSATCLDTQADRDAAQEVLRYFRLVRYGCFHELKANPRPPVTLLQHVLGMFPVIACTCLRIVELLSQLCSLSAAVQGGSASGTSGRGLPPPTVVAFQIGIVPLSANFNAQPWRTYRACLLNQKSQR